ncbi:MAG: peptidoglycan editing factor PgeF [Burkholderiales bacterium]
MTIPAEWIIPAWPAPKNVRALITTRAGGVSEGGYASMNLGAYVNDAEKSVAENRAILRKHIPAEPKWLRQVHGTRVVNADNVIEAPEADASIARQPHSVCVIAIADCVPILFCDAPGSVVAAAHAGWRGLRAGVIENTVREMNCASAELMAYLGPAIGPQNFEVGDEVRQAFVQQGADASAAFKPKPEGKWLADIYLLVRQRLHAVGVTQIYGGGFCTVAEARFFSHRRDKVSGRMAALIWLEKSDSE